MNDLSAYYTAVDREIFALLDYFIALQHDFERRGGHDPDGPKKIEEFNRFRALVDMRTKQRRKVAEERAEQEQLEMDSRTQVFCLTCKAERKVHIGGEQRVDPPGVMCDRVKCTVCGSEFTAQVPNTTTGKLKYAEYLLQVLTMVRADGRSLMERDHKQDDVARLIKSIKDLKKAERDVELEDQTRERNRANADQKLVETRDLLLFWKLQNSNPGSQGGMA